MRHLVWALLPLSRQIFVQNSNLETSERAEMPYYQRSLPNHQIFPRSSYSFYHLKLHTPGIGFLLVSH